MSEFLTSDEVAELTGKKRHPQQLAWLAKSGWIYETNAAGRPIISREYARARMGGHQPAQPIGGSPNFSALS